MHRIMRGLAAISVLLSALMAHAAVQPGVDYEVMNPRQPTDSPGKVEVIEFFWYGCPHCNALARPIEAWRQKLPPDVAFRLEHVMWAGRSDMGGHLKVFAALKSLNALPAHHDAVFDAIHQQRVELRRESELFDWIEKRGMKRAEFEAAYNSFGARTLFARALQLTTDYRIDSVPVMIVNGKYKVSMKEAKTGQRMLEIVSELVARERAALPKVVAPAAKAATPAKANTNKKPG